jgi:very-short-patch-repair endonuclease
MDPVTALAEVGGYARWPALAARGVPRSMLLKACRTGAVQRPVRGLFALPTVADEAGLLAAMARGQLSCAHAAAAHGLDVFRLPADVHVRIPERSQRVVRLPRVLLHRRGQRAESQLTDLGTTLVDCLGCLPIDEAVATWDSALRTGRMHYSELRALAQRSGALARTALALVDPGSQSVLESVARVVLAQENVGELASQVFVPNVGWVDLVIDHWLVLELDGWAAHQATFREDRRRDAELARLGFVVLRFTFADIARRRNWFVQVVRETLDRGHPPFWFGVQHDDFAPSRDDTPA